MSSGCLLYVYKPPSLIKSPRIIPIQKHQKLISPQGVNSRMTVYWSCVRDFLIFPAKLLLSNLRSNFYFVVVDKNRK